MERIRGLAIPPAWRDVWICRDPLGHIQATGIDEAGRKQYLYHERWQQRAAQRKFESMRRVRRVPAGAAPRGRSAICGVEGMPRERALACAVRLLDLGFFRIGGEDYAEENESFGLATVRREHVSIEDGEVVFDFPAKSGQRRVQSIRDPAVEARRSKRCGAGAAGPRTCSPVASGRRVARRPLRRRQRLHPGEGRRGVLGQGLPHLARHRAGGGRAGAASRAPSSKSGGEGSDPSRDQAGRRGDSATRRRSAAAPTSTHGSSNVSATARQSSCREPRPMDASLPERSARSSGGSWI